MNVLHEPEIKFEKLMLEHGVKTIGRSNDNDIVIDDNSVSGKHARIATFFNASYIEDLHSTNGTHVNGQQVRQRILREGDTINIGTRCFIVSGINKLKVVPS